MTSSTSKMLAFAGLAVFLALFSTGCASCNPGQYQIDVELDESLKEASVVVDLVGVNGSSLPRWESYSMTKYWQESDPMRREAEQERVTISFVSGQSLTQSVAATNAVWEKWQNRNVTHVMVLASPPGAHTDQPGIQDSRRQILPLDTCHWIKKTEALELLVKRSGIDVITPVRPAK